MVPVDSRKVSPASRYSGFHYAHSGFTYGAVTRCGRPFQSRSIHLRDAMLWSYYPAWAVTPTVWAGSRSLATTWEITVVFSSSGYLDVSVPRVRPPRLLEESGGCPIRKSMDLRFFAAPHGFSQRTTSFIASQRQGIHQMPLRRLIALISQCPCQ